MQPKIAIQGYQASFHEITAIQFFGKDITTIECATFPKLFDVMKNKQADFAVCAIENSLAGSLLPNYANLRNSTLTIIGEVYLQIEMNLMALSGQTIEQIEEVHSHPIALLQCSNYFENYPNIQIVESNDTALSAKEIKENHIKHRAAIGSSYAAKLYDLKIIATDIHNNKRNFTRFLILADVDSKHYHQGTINKASLSFRAYHTSGSLANVLSMIAKYNINLTKIQSLPVIGEEWQYYMYVDLEFDSHDAYKNMLKEIESLTKELKVLGEYAQGEKIA